MAHTLKVLSPACRELYFSNLYIYFFNSIKHCLRFSRLKAGLNTNMYLWRKMNDLQREYAIKYRRLRCFPKHAPPHFDFEGERQYLITAACYEHAHFVEKSPERMSNFEVEILETCEKFSTAIYA